MPAAGVGEHSGDEVTLGDLQPGLVFLLELPLGIDLGPRRQQVGKPLGRHVDQIRHAERVLEVVGQRFVDTDRIRPRLRR